MPDFGKITFDKRSPLDLESVFPDASKHEVDLLRQCLKYDSRSTADKLLASPYFSEYPPKLIKLMPEDKRVKVQTRKYEEIFNLNN